MTYTHMYELYEMDGMGPPHKTSARLDGTGACEI